MSIKYEDSGIVNLISQLTAFEVFDGKYLPHPLYEEKFYILTQNPVFYDRMISLRIKYGIPENGFKNASVAQAWAKSLGFKDIQKLDQDISKLGDELHYSHRWYPIVNYYLLFHKDGSKFLLPDFLDISIVRSGSNSVLTLQLHSDTTLDAIQEMWPEIQKLQNIVYGKRTKAVKQDLSSTNIIEFAPEGTFKVTPVKGKRHVRNDSFKRNAKAFYLKRSGLTLSQIAEVLGPGFTYTDVSAWIRMFETTIQNNYLV